MTTTLRETELRPRSELLLPPPQLSGCLFAGVFRDTRGTCLSDEERFNHFPASPLVTVTYVIAGDLRLVRSVDGPNSNEPIVRCSVTPPQETPITSWSPDCMAVVSVAIYPDAWAKMGHIATTDIVAQSLSAAFRDVATHSDLAACWAGFCNAFAPSWQVARTVGGLADWSGSTRLTDWAQSVAARAALAGPGRSIRAIERRLKRWSRHSRQSLKFYSDFENLHSLSAGRTNIELAGLASDAGYADQSHMGRAVRRATGFSPAQLNTMIATKEAFWCYRLLGERF